jgi:pyruvate/2-oxoglutarate dehydrogenase complex dihydrolipoamide acyltransferase (E2) component
MDLFITMPQLGLTMTEGTVVEWLKRPGETIEKNEIVVIVSTDKVDVEVESMVKGRLREIVVEPGTTVPVGEVLAVLDGPEL